MMAVKINYSTVGFVNWGKDYITLYEDLLKWRTKRSFKPDFDFSKPNWKLV